MLSIQSLDDGLVRIDFGKPVTWIAMPAEQAVLFAETILKHARGEARGTTQH